MAAYALAIFTGAFLLFQVQPLMGKFLLPWFGGAPGVWTSCLLFFQIVLLVGYGYAHLMVRWLKPRAQVGLHLVLLTLAIATLPVTPHPAAHPQPGTTPVLEILLILTRCVGLPYFILSATAPLIQHWSSRTHPQVSPFPLYALSNAASLVALVTYPTLFEVATTRATQATVWSAGLYLYALCCVWAGRGVWKSVPPSRPADASARDKLPSVQERLLWLALPSCASLLLVAVTNAICQDIAAIPLLWVLPLALYLLSFTLCFANHKWYNRLWFGVFLFPCLAAISALHSGRFTAPIPLQIAIYSVGLFVCSMVCHGELYRLRPGPDRLTLYYLTLTAGGALGGAFVAVLAPLIFKDYFELDCGIILCGALFLMTCASERGGAAIGLRAKVGFGLGCLLVAGLAVFLWRAAHQYDAIRLARARNFYGVLKVFRHEFPDPKLNLIELVHGHVAHGVQFEDPGRAAWPTLYYTPQSGVGRALTAIPAGKRRIGVVGLGAGTLATYARPGDEVRFYEINPDVVEFARTQFTYLQRAEGKITVVLGDARISLEAEPSQHFDLLVLDAFNSDSIPVHLLTREAFQIYQRHLDTNGVLAINISNRSLDLEPVIAGMAGLFGYEGSVVNVSVSDEPDGILPSSWILLSRDHQFFEQPPIREAGPTIASTRASAVWTDDYSTLFSIIRWLDRSPAEPDVSSEPASAVGHTTPAPSRMATQIARFREAVSRDPNSPVALNNLACLLATASDPGLRNGGEAVRLAEHACELTQYQNTSVLSTLAAAYAESGRFQDAIATAQKACAMASERGETALLEGNRKMLELYTRSQAYHIQEPQSR